MDLTGVTVEDAAPLMCELEAALAKPHCRTVVIKDSASDSNPLRFTRAQAERLLARLEAEFFGTKH